MKELKVGEGFVPGALELVLVAREQRERLDDVLGGAGEKDAVEACLSRAVCAGEILLDEARRRIWSDWRAAGKACEGMTTRVRSYATLMSSRYFLHNFLL